MADQLKLNDPVGITGAAEQMREIMVRSNAFTDGRRYERLLIVEWLTSLDKESGDINRFLPTTLANWIGEQMHLAREG